MYIIHTEIKLVYTVHMHVNLRQSRISQWLEARLVAQWAEARRHRRLRALEASRYRQMEEHRATRYGARRAQDTSRVRGPLSTTRSAERPMSRLLAFFPYLEVLPSPAGIGLAIRLT